MSGHQTHLEVEALRRAVDALLAVEPAALPGRDLAALLVDVETQRRRLEAVDQLLVAELDRQSAGYEFGAASTGALLTQLLRVTPMEAKARVARAGDLGPRRGLTGEPLEPILHATAAAVQVGAISSAHAAVISRCMDAIPADVAYEVNQYAESFLVEAAKHEHPGSLRRTAALLLSRLDPDGIEPREQDLEDARGFSLLKRRDGSSVPRGQLTAELTAQLEAVFDSLAAPQPSGAGEPDARSGAQRRHDALAAALTRILRSGELPDCGGVPVTILARTTLAELQAMTGVAATGHGQQLSIAKLLQMAGDAAVIPVVCNDAGGILAYGRERRLATRGQRLALAARDGGCCFSGCDRPASWTEVHHVQSWLAGGGTDVDNLCLLCRYHHRHFEAAGWELLMINGVPWWRPPGWLDREQRPIRNTAHHPPDMVFPTSG